MSLELKHYLTAWQLSDPQPLAQTSTSHVYTVQHAGKTVVLKLLTPLGVKDESSGAVALRHFDGHGAVRLLHSDTGAHLLEYANGDDLIPMVARGQDEAATVIIADVLNKLHDQPLGTVPDRLVTLRRWFRSLFRKAATDQDKGERSILVRAAPVAEGLLSDPVDVRVLHGDIHHGNIRHVSGRGWLAFDPKGLVGERTYDAANTLCNPMDMPELVTDEARLLRNVDLLSKHAWLDQARLLAFVFAYACLSASWSLEDGQSPNTALEVAAIIEPHVRSF
jgi:streptomycin 6-kinase